MRKTSLRLSIAFLLGIASISAIAAGSVRYKWRDAEGNLHYSDSLPADANVLGYDVVTGQGVLVKRVAPAMSPDERAAAKIKEAEDRSTQSETERQAREDQQLLAANPTEADLLESQRQQVEMIDLQIKSLQTGLESLERNLTELLGRAADQEREGNAIPAKLANQIADIRSKIDAQHKRLDRNAAEKKKTTTGFSAELDRYRALRDKYKQN
jgi:chromosome segregation ATPase